jgi:hypothetical protein
MVGRAPSRHVRIATLREVLYNRDTSCPPRFSDYLCTLWRGAQYMATVELSLKDSALLLHVRDVEPFV